MLAVSLRVLLMFVCLSLNSLRHLRFHTVYWFIHKRHSAGGVLRLCSVSCELESGCQMQLGEKAFEVRRDWLCVAAVLTAQVCDEACARLSASH